MHEDLVNRLRELHPEEFSNSWWDFAFACQQAMHEAADAIEELTGFVQEAERDRDEYRERLDKANDTIEELAAFKAQITDGHFYCMRDGILYEAKLNPPNAKSIKLPPIKFAEQPKEKADV